MPETWIEHATFPLRRERSATKLHRLWQSEATSRICLRDFDAIFSDKWVLMFDINASNGPAWSCGTWCVSLVDYWVVPSHRCATGLHMVWWHENTPDVYASIFWMICPPYNLESSILHPWMHAGYFVACCVLPELCSTSYFACPADSSLTLRWLYSSCLVSETQNCCSSHAARVWINRSNRKSRDKRLQGITVPYKRHMSPWRT